MSSGGKGGSETQVTEIPDWLRDPTIRNLARAEKVQQMEYQPWTGLDVAALTPQQQAANQMTLDAASAFGMMPQGYQNITPTSGMPQQQVSGGVAGYSSNPMYQAAVQSSNMADPRTAQVRAELYGNDPNGLPYGDVNLNKVYGKS